ncbi:MAG: Lrp/AsnC family transcriptional regulator, partial [Clostridia bacterium]
TAETMASMFGTSLAEVEEAINDLENEGIIVGYKAVINTELTSSDVVDALIELKVSPQRDKGFGIVAERIRNYPEVKSVYLMSGGFDLMLMIEGKTMRDIAYFVAEKLATTDGVTATATHFVLQKYKDNGMIFEKEKEDKRGNTW